MDKVRRENSFRIPDGYFENLTSEVMSRLPEKNERPVNVKKQPTRWEKIKPWLYMTAMFVGAALIVRVASVDRTADTTDWIAMDDTELEMISDEYFNSVVNNSMLDDYSLYVYLTDAVAVE